MKKEKGYKVMKFKVLNIKSLEPFAKKFNFKNKVIKNGLIGNFAGYRMDNSIIKLKKK